MYWYFVSNVNLFTSSNRTMNEIVYIVYCVLLKPEVDDS